MRIFTSFFYVLLVVGGVLGVEEKKVTVMKGDTVTLNPDDAEIQTGDLILWKFEGSIIGRRKTDGSISTYDGPGGIFKEKLLLDKLTGCLTITDLTTDHTGLYTLEIKKSITETRTNYSVTVNGLSVTEIVLTVVVGIVGLIIIGFLVMKIKKKIKKRGAMAHSSDLDFL